MKSFIDENGNKHYAKEQLASDKQGVLYLTRGEGVVICDASNSEEDNQKYIDAKLLPLESVENVIMPSLYLKEPSVGYVMLLPKDFSPLSDLLSPEENKQEFYTKTGGLKRRLLLMAELAKTFHILHSLPCMYGRLSPHRVFVPNDNDKTETLLLYSINMTATMPFSSEADANGYTAPESKNGMATIRSDVYSFSKLAYDVLTLNGAFSDIVDNSSHLADMLALAASDDPNSRPMMPDIYKSLLQLRDMLVSCQDCRRDFVYVGKRCPFCKKRLAKMLKAKIIDVVEDRKIERGNKMFELTPGVQQCFWSYHTEHILFRDSIEPSIGCMAGISSSKKLRFIIKNLMQKDLNVNEKILAPTETIAIPLPSGIINISFPLYSLVYRHIEMVIE